MAKRAKCLKCRRAAQWLRSFDVPLTRLRCRRCGSRMSATSHLLRWPVEEVVPEENIYVEGIFYV